MHEDEGISCQCFMLKIRYTLPDVCYIHIADCKCNVIHSRCILELHFTENNVTLVSHTTVGRDEIESANAGHKLLIQFKKITFTSLAENTE